MRRVCTDRHAVSRIPVRHLADAGTCGTCGAALPPRGAPIGRNVRGAIDEIIAGARVPVLADVRATWCGPCRAAAPEVKRAVHELAGRAVVLEVDTGALDELARCHRGSSIPRFCVFEAGRRVRPRAAASDAR